ncbi:MAG: ABC transporter permease [Bryobacteraceae bacterium]
MLRPLRQLLRSPSFTVPSVAGLALAIGASTAVFSVFAAMLLHSLGFQEVGRLVALWQSDNAHGQQYVEVSWADYQAWRSAGDVIEDVALASSVNLDFPLFAGGEPEHVDGTTVTGSFFRVLGATPLAGRFFTDEDDLPGAPVRVVLSHSLWKSHFGGDYGVVGKQFKLGTNAITVIGVTRPEFDFPREVSLWVPVRPTWPDVEKSTTLGVFRAVARLKPGVSAKQAQARLAVLARQQAATLPPGSPSYVPSVTPLIDEIYGAARPAVLVLLGAVLLVLLIACANVANLLLARSTARAREIAVRAALGANRWPLVKLLLGEAAWLAGLSAGLGLLLAGGGIRVLAALAPPDVPRIADVALDLPVLMFGIVLSSLTVLVFGLGPAIHAARRDPQEALKQGGTRTTSSRSQASVRRGLIVAEVALSAVLLIGAGLLVKSFAKLSTIHPGFQAQRVLTFRVTLQNPDQESRRAFFTQVLERVRALPGVESAGAVLIRPLSGTVGWDTTYLVEGQTPTESATNPFGNYEAISPSYFGTMNIRLLEGRDFTEGDNHTAQGVVIINKATAHRHWPQGNAVGRHIRMGRDPKAPWLTVAGVVDDVRYREWEAARPDFYIPYLQRAQHRSDFVVKTSGDPNALVKAVRGAVFSVDKNQPISNVTTMDRLVDAALARARFNSMVLAALAMCAVALAVIGIYGVLAYSVAQRGAEIGIRMAVGATPSRIVSMVTGEGVRLAAMGAAIGLGGAVLASDWIVALLFNVDGLDPVVYLLSATLLVAAGAAASSIPAARASATDPARTLHGD